MITEIKIALIIAVVVALFAAGVWVATKHEQTKELVVEKQKTEQLVEAQKEEQKKTIVLNKQKQAFSVKADKMETKVYEETIKPEYSPPVPESGRVLINDAIDEANSYIKSSQ